MFDTARSNLSQKNSFAEFEIVGPGPLGRGACSFVYQVIHRKKKNFAALKVIDKKKIKSSNSLKILQNEITIHKKMKDKNVVKLFKCFEDQSNHYLLMEYCAKGELFKLLKKEGKNLNLKMIKKLGIQIAKGLQYIHSLDIIHRDLKPGNIFLDSEGDIKIGDFGLAIEEKKELLEKHRLVGTPNYIAPEVLIKGHSVGKAVDIWAFGCILYNMAKGCPPFDSKNVKTTLRKIQSNKPDLKNVHPMLLDLIKKCLSSDPKSRPTISQILHHQFFYNRAKAVKPNKNSLTTLNKWFQSNTIQRKNLKKSTQSNKFIFGSSRFKKFHTPKKRTQTGSITSIPKSSKSRANSHKPSRYFHKSLSRKSKRTSSRSIISNSITSSFSIFQSLNKTDMKKENSKSNLNGFKPRMINTEGIPPCVYETKNGRISIKNDGRLELELLRKKRIIIISGDGARVVVKNLKDDSKNFYTIENLPPKYNSVYKYAHEVLDLIKSKVPKCKFENKYGKFLLMKNEPFPNFEAYFQAGLKLVHQVSSEKVIVKYQNTQREIGLFNGDLDKVDQMTKNQVEMAMKYLNLCLKQE